jgi:hypothetical protein
MPTVHGAAKMQVTIAMVDRGVRLIVRRKHVKLCGSANNARSVGSAGE